MSCKFNDRTPIYIQIMEEIKKEIITNKLKNGDKMPSVREFSEIMNVNPNTVQRAYQELERQNITYTQRGLGTFITNDMDKILMIKDEMSENILQTFIDKMRSLNLNDVQIIETVKNFLERGNN